MAGRLRGLREEDLDEAQREVWAAITGGARAQVPRPGGGLVGPDGALVGPFNVLLHSPEVGNRVQALGEALRFHNSLDRRLLELAVITVGAHWRAEFEWWAHRRLALQAGLSEEVADAIARGDDPPYADEDEAVVHRFTRQLLADGRPDEATYEAARDRLGERAVVDLVALVGYYCMISFVLNAFEVPLPEGVTPVWSQG